MLATSDITDLVGARIDWGSAPQGSAFPYIVLSMVSGFEGMHMNGTGPFEGRFQVDCYGLTFGAADTVALAVIDALHFYRGGGFLIISHTSTRDSREDGSNEADRPFRASLDFNTTWRPI